MCNYSISMRRFAAESNANKRDRNHPNTQRPRREGRVDASAPPEKQRRDNQAPARYDTPDGKSTSTHLSRVDSSATSSKQRYRKSRSFSERAHATAGYNAPRATLSHPPLLRTPDRAQVSSDVQPEAKQDDLSSPPTLTIELTDQPPADSRKRSRQLSGSSTSSVVSVEALDRTPSPKPGSTSPLPPPPRHHNLRLTTKKTELTLKT